MIRQIRWRTLLPFLIILGGAVAVTSLLILNHAQEQAVNQLHTHLENTAHLVDMQASPYFGTPDESSRLTTLADQISDSFNVDVIFLDMNGQLLGTTLAADQLPSNPVDLMGVSQAIIDGQADLFIDDVAIFTKVIRNENGQDLGIVHLQIPLKNSDLDISYIFRLATGIILISLIGIVIVSLFIKEHSLVPNDRLTIAAQEISYGNFNELSFPSNAGELEELNQAMQDIARKVGAQIESLSKERGMLSAVLNQMTDGVIITDSEGRVKLMNPAAERIFQIRQSVDLDRSIVEVLRYHQLVDLWRKANNGDRQSTMLEIGPQHLFLQVVGIPLMTSLPGGTMLLTQDLTQLRRLETVRRDFISNVSHELRTPLASLKALAETLQEGALDDPPAARRFILRMETEIDNLTQLVNELLELSRIESGKVPLSFHRVQPCELLQPAYERMVLQAERAGLQLTLSCKQDLPSVFADPDRISQVLINLVHNAIKFTPPDGEISLNAYLDGEQIVFFVKDTGVGIARKDLGRIFERFYKADRARAGGGTGLGLSISRLMIESHGGYIWAESEEGVGSSFYFTLPIA